MMANIPAFTPAKGQHIFPANQIKDLALEWQTLMAAGQRDAAIKKLDSIIVLSTQMFERLAQHEHYTFTVDLQTLVAAAQEKVPRWLEKWDPGKGEIFSWFSKCAKNAFRSEVVRVAQQRRRYHDAGDDLEKYFGSEDHTTMATQLDAEISRRLSGITSRWLSERENGAIRYHLDCITHGVTGDRPAVIRGAAYAYGISLDMSKFLHSWSLCQLRAACYDMSHAPYTQQDLYRLEHHNTLLIDMLDIVTWDQMRKLIAVFGGSRIKFPTMAQLARTAHQYRVHRKVMDSDQDPDSLAAIAKAEGVSKRAVQDAHDAFTDYADCDPYAEEEVYSDRPHFEDDETADCGSSDVDD